MQCESLALIVPTQGIIEASEQWAKPCLHGAKLHGDLPGIKTVSREANIGRKWQWVRRSPLLNACIGDVVLIGRDCCGRSGC